jgi:hypothetical protein
MLRTGHPGGRAVTVWCVLMVGAVEQAVVCHLQHDPREQGGLVGVGKAVGFCQSALACPTRPSHGSPPPAGRA